MKTKLTQIVIATVTVLCGCSDWPPKRQFLVENFNENRQDIEMLKTRFEGSQFDEVAAIGDGEVLGYRLVGNPGEGDLEMPAVELPDSEAWASLFDRTNTESIRFNERGGVSLNIPQASLADRPKSIASYENGAVERSSLLSCNSEIAKIRCGFCKVELDHDWWLRFGWLPVDLTDNETLAWKNGEMTDDEYWSLVDQVRRDCIADGGTPIG